ncbi:MAG: tRNA lysidine(34) synthetase TilS [Pseudomonadota bacterium]
MTGTSQSDPIGGEEADALFARFADPGCTALAVSGGADSTGLLHLAAAWRARGKGRDLFVLTVDHGLRRDAKAEAKAVCRQAEMLGLPYRTLALGLGSATDQAGAREARYAALEAAARDAGATHLATAHHQDDQAETFLLRLARGSGLRGLTGMADSRPLQGIMLVRPFLTVPKARLVATCRARGLTWADDPSNADGRYARAGLRPHLPLLAELGLTAGRLADTAARLARAQAAIDEAVAAALAEARVFENGLLRFPSAVWNAPDEVSLRALEAVLRAVDGGAFPPRLERLEALLIWLREDGRDGRTLNHCRIARRDDAAYAWREAGRDGLSTALLGPGENLIWDARFRLQAGANPMRIGPLDAHVPLDTLPATPSGSPRGLWREAWRTGPAWHDGEAWRCFATRIDGPRVTANLVRDRLAAVQDYRAPRMASSTAVPPR